MGKVIVIFLDLKVQSIRRLIYGVEIEYTEVYLGMIAVAICHCFDARNFSPTALRRIILSDQSALTVLAVAYSITDGNLYLRFEFLN
jgi:hypothetical protein